MRWNSLVKAVGCVGLLFAVGFIAADESSLKKQVVAEKSDPASSPTNSESKAPSFVKLAMSGKIVWMSEALEKRFEIMSVPEAKQRVLALETPAGELHPIIEDLRGRSFRTDKRLREMDLELVVRRYKGTPMLRVIGIREIKNGKKYIVDYWCDVCAITMFESGPCACCQDHNRLRKRKID